MQVVDIDRVLNQLRAALSNDDLERAATILQELWPPDQADVLVEMYSGEVAVLLPALPPEESADILEEMTDAAATEVLAVLSTDQAVQIVAEMEPDEAADVLSAMEPAQAQQVLDLLDDPDEIRPLLLHPDDSAGGLMTSDFLALRRQMTAAEGLDAIRRWQPEDDELLSVLYVVDRFGQLSGQINLHRLILANPTTPIIDIMTPEVISVPLGTDQEVCARLMSRYDLTTLPVVDETHRLVGLITVDDVIDVLVAEATEDIQRLGASEPLDKPYLASSVWDVTRKRLGWLLLLFLTETLTGSVLRHFEGELQAAVALSFFIPLLIGTGGNAGSQTTSTIIRALATGDIQKRDWFRGFWHELRVGLLLGGAMALIAFGRALLWGTGNPIALTVSAAILTIVIWSNILGSLLPMIAARLRIDPTVVSGPAMSTLVDATGLFIYFTIARLFLGL